MKVEILVVQYSKPAGMLETCSDDRSLRAVEASILQLRRV